MSSKGCNAVNFNTDESGQGDRCQLRACEWTAFYAAADSLSIGGPVISLTLLMLMMIDSNGDAR
jgi:hypothetical protein